MRRAAIALGVVVVFLAADRGSWPEYRGAWHAGTAAVRECHGDVTSVGLPGVTEIVAAYVCRGGPAAPVDWGHVLTGR